MTSSPEINTSPNNHSDSEKKQPVTFTPLKRSTPQPLSSRLSGRVVASGAVGILTAVVIGSLYLITSAAPGDRFYATKVNTFEPLIALTKRSDTAKVSYDITRVETRLGELQTLLADQSTTSPDTITLIGEQIASYATGGVETLTSSELSLIDRMQALARMETAVKASERLAEDNEEISPAKDAISRGRDAIAEARKSTAESLAQSNDSTAIEGYLRELIARIGERITLVAPGSEAQRIALTRVRDAEEAIADGDLSFALTALLRADEAIDLDQYLYDSERGEGPQKQDEGPSTTEGQ